MKVTKRSLGGVGLALGVLLMLAAKAIGSITGKEGRGAADHVQQPRIAWAKRAVGDVSVETPGTFAVVPDPIPASLRETAARTLVGMEEARGDGGTVSVWMRTFTYRGVVQVSLDGLARAVVQQISQLDGVADFTSRIDTVNQSALPGRRVSAAFTMHGHHARAEDLLLQRGQVIFQIQATGLGDSVASIAALRRIIQSVSIRRE